MEENRNENLDEIERKENRYLLRNTLFSFLTKSSILIFGITTSMLVARLISIEDWGLLILSISYISIITLITAFLPPALEYTVIYYIPKFKILKESRKMKSFIKRAIILKLIFLIPIVLISIFTFPFVIKTLIVSLNDNLLLLYILTPMIFILGFTPLLEGILRSFNMFKTIFFLTLIGYIVHVSLLFVCFYFFREVTIEIIAITNIIAIFIPFLLTIIIIVIKLHAIKVTDEDNSSLKEFIKTSFEYGIPISFGYFLTGFWTEIQIQGVGYYDVPENVTGYKIGSNFSTYSDVLLGIFYLPLFTALSRLKTLGKENQIKRIFNLSNKFLVALLLLFSGIMFFIIDFFLFLIYSESYLVFSILLKLLLLSKISIAFYIPFEIMLLINKKEKVMFYCRLFRTLINISLFFIGLIFFGILGGILGIILANVIILFLYIAISPRVLNIEVDLKRFITQYLIFGISLLITLLLGNTFISQLNSMILYNLHFSSLTYLPMISIILFVVLFIILNFSLNVFSNSDFNYIQSFFNRDKKMDKIIRKTIKILKRINIFSKD